LVGTTTPRFNGTPNQTIGLVNDDGQAPQISLADIAPITEGDSGTKTLQVTINASPAPAQPISVQIDTADGTAVAATRRDRRLRAAREAGRDDERCVEDVDITIIGTGPGARRDVPRQLVGAEQRHAGAASKDATIQNDDFGQITTGVGRAAVPT